MRRIQITVKRTDRDIFNCLRRLAVDGEVRITQADLARESGYSKRTIEYATSRLETAGYLRRRGGRGRAGIVYEGFADA